MPLSYTKNSDELIIISDPSILSILAASNQYERISCSKNNLIVEKLSSPESLTIALMLAENEDSAINRWMKKTSLY